jgi:hypothetical protein
MRRGTLLIFDEFYDRDNEFRAFNDYLRVSHRQYRVIGEVGCYSQVCIEIQG